VLKDQQALKVTLDHKETQDLRVLKDQQVLKVI
jgi:hypothetical protein